MGYSSIVTVALVKAISVLSGDLLSDKDDEIKECSSESPDLENKSEEISSYSEEGH